MLEKNITYHINQLHQTALQDQPQESNIYLLELTSNLGFCRTSVQEFLREMSDKDEKINSLRDMGFSEDEANMAITICGMPLFERHSFFMEKAPPYSIYFCLKFSQVWMLISLYWLTQLVHHMLQKFVTLETYLTIRYLVV